MRIIYRLRDNEILSKGYYEASMGSGPYGLKITHGVPAGEEWRENIRTGVLPTLTRSGTIRKCYNAGMMGSDPCFEMVTDAGEAFDYMRYLTDSFDDCEYCRGRRVEVDVVRQSVKTPCRPQFATETDVVLEIRIDDSRPLCWPKRMLRRFKAMFRHGR